MFLTISQTKSGVRYITEYSEENVFNKTFQDTTQVYKVRNSVFEGGIFKFEGRKLKCLSHNNFMNDFPILYEKSVIPEKKLSIIGGHSYISHVKIPIDIMKRYYDKFINIGSLENEQDDPDIYKLKLDTLFYDPNPTQPYRKHMLSGNIHFKGTRYEL